MVQKLQICEKKYFDQLLDFSMLLYCAIFNSLNAGFFFNTIRVSNSLDPDQARHFVGPDLGPNCLRKVSADDKSRC